jgi:hypothetical protein
MFKTVTNLFQVFTRDGVHRMQKRIPSVFLCAVFLLLPRMLSAQQIVINEVDADQSGADNAEFIELFDGGVGNTIGGTTPAARNIISGNDVGVRITDGAESNDIFGNYIGTDVTGTTALGNKESGVLMTGAARANEIGGLAPGEGNVISGNEFAGGNVFGFPGGVAITSEASLN